MKTIFRILAVAVVLAGTAIWLVTGANRGFTKTSVEVKTVDPVTGIDAIEYKKQFVPGLDFLGAAAVGAVVLAGISFAVKNKPSNKTK